MVDAESSTRQSTPEQATATPEAMSPISPTLKVWSGKILRPRPVRTRRSGSLDGIVGHYQNGQWPRDPVVAPATVEAINEEKPPLNSDKTTQTPEDWTPIAVNLRSTVAVGGERREKRSHATSTAPAMGTRSGMSSPRAMVGSPDSQPPAAKRPVIRIGSSVEGPSTEVERAMSALARRYVSPQPDGRRAPVTELLGGFRSVDTQTPGEDERGGGSAGSGDNSSAPSSGMEEDRPSSNSTNGSPMPGSPASTIPIIIGALEGSRPGTTDTESAAEAEGEGALRAATPDLSRGMAGLGMKEAKASPNRSFMFVREPPDGCEKAGPSKATEEAAIAARSSFLPSVNDKAHFVPRMKETLLWCPVATQPKMFNIPSTDSAFNPPCKRGMSPITAGMSPVGSGAASPACPSPEGAFTPLHGV